MQIKELHSREEIGKTFLVLKQVYEDLKESSYVQKVLNLMQRGYKMAGIFENETDECIGVVGIKITKKLQYGRVLEIEDFIICRKTRGVGVEKMLMRWIEWQAVNFDCNKIVATIDTSRIESHKILSREGFLLEGFKFIK